MRFPALRPGDGGATPGSRSTPNAAPPPTTDHAPAAAIGRRPPPVGSSRARPWGGASELGTTRTTYTPSDSKATGIEGAGTVRGWSAPLATSITWMTPVAGPDAVRYSG